ncbi:PAAR domain-containing protein [Burkholderia metallica]|uniref:PAAR domain-containing protein n=1 Tax=Burkholderia metallica TaxID=488729 RepID=UPI001CF54CAB|nr:PAAR domain-containing protein [Burkholderia metallica]MCA8002211.1 PAAR domain-containing protein [Burkholderia metallica]
MIRYFLAKGDRAGNAVIIEGLDTVTCSNPPPSVPIATLDMKTYCSACKREGYIAPQGPRWPGTGPNGKQWALSGDINVCGCNPPPIFHAERGMRMIFTAGEAAMLNRRNPDATGRSFARSVAVHDQQFTLLDDTRLPLSNIRYRIVTDTGQIFSGTTDTAGQTRRIVTDASASLKIYTTEH